MACCRIAYTTDGVDLLSLASSPIGRRPSQGVRHLPSGAGGGAPAPYTAHTQSSHYLAQEDEEDVPYERSMQYTEVETPQHGGPAGEFCARASAGCDCTVHGSPALFELFRPILQRKSCRIAAFSHLYSPYVRSQWHKWDTRALTITR
jgi:hypothetical protein